MLPLRTYAFKHELKSNRLNGRIKYDLKSSNELTSFTESSSFNTWASINKGGLYNSFEVYTSHKETQDLIVGQISNWVQVEKNCDLLPGSSSHSVIFASIDGERVIHNVGWKLDGLYLNTAFKMFRDRANDCEGTPAGLKECTHIYDPLFSVPKNSAIQFLTENSDSYPLYNIDVFTCKLPEWQDELTQELEIAVSYIGSKFPDLKSIHVLKSTDKLSCIVIGACTSIDIHDAFEDIPGYKEHMEKAKKLAVHGTMADLMSKKNPNRLYYVADVNLF
eukprot:gene6593-13339_t